MTHSDPSNEQDDQVETGRGRVVTPDGDRVTDGENSPAPGTAAPRGETTGDEEVSTGSPEDAGDVEDVEDVGDATDAEDASRIEEPAKVMRIGSMIKRLLDEVRDAPLDDAARTRLAEIHERSLTELEDGLSPDLVEELHRITLPFTDDGAPSDAELRVAQAQLVGWLEGLFHGIQTALVAQQMAAQAQLSQMRRALPPGAGAAPFGPGGHGESAAHGQRPGPQDGRPSPGQYL